jgi:hypothetical protein
LNYPLSCPACEAFLCDATGGHAPSLRALIAHFERAHRVAELLAGEIARSVILHRFGVVTDEELDELVTILREPPPLTDAATATIPIR